MGSISDSSSHVPNERDLRLGEIIAAFCEARDRGELGDWHDLLKQHPELAEEISEFFTGQEDMNRLVGSKSRNSDDSSSPTPTPTQVLNDPISPRTPRSAALQMELPKKLFDDYELQEEIARGGMGIVYKARQISLNRPVAVKLMLSGSSSSGEDLRRFRLEAEAAAQLDHPNIVPIYEVGERDGQAYFSMKLIEGCNLAEVRNRLEYAPREIARLMALVARAVDFAHQHGILHRDLKPSNILVGGLSKDDGSKVCDDRPPTRLRDPHYSSRGTDPATITPYVTDFGLAKRLDIDTSVTQTGVIVGTPSYMAPEQAAAKGKVGPQADIYSLGAILYFLLTGRRPFEAETALETLVQVQHEAPLPPRSLRPHIPAALETICLKCLEKEPGHRYAAAADLAADLERFTEGMPIVARRARPWERVWRFARRQPRWTLAAAMMACFAVVAGVALWRNYLLTQQISSGADREYAQKVREYAQNLKDAESTIENRAKAEEILSRCAKDMRGWEWHYLRQRCRQNTLVLFGHTDAIINLTFQPAGPLLVSTAKDKTVRGWDTESGRCRYVIEHESIPSGNVAISPDGNMLATSTETAALLWRTDPAAPPRLVHRIPVTDVTRRLCFSADGSKLCRVADKLTLWDVASAHVVKTIPINPDKFGSLGGIAAASRMFLFFDVTEITLRDADTGEVLMTVETPGDCTGASLSPDGSLLAVGQNLPTEGFVRVWDPERKRKIHDFQSKLLSPWQALRFVDDNRTVVAVTFSAEVRAWDARAGRPAPIVETKAAPAMNFFGAIRHDGKEIASASSEAVTINVRSIFRRSLQRELRGDGWLVVGGDRLLVGNPNGPPLLWSLEDEDRSQEVSNEPTSAVAISPDGNRLAVADAGGGVSIRNPAGLDQNHYWAVADRPVTHLAFSGDGQRLACCVCSQDMSIWDAENGRQLWSMDGSGRTITSLAISPDGQYVAASTTAGNIEIWQARDGKKVAKFAGHGPLQAKSFHDSTLAYSEGDRILLRNLAKGVIQSAWSGSAAQQVVFFSLDGSRLFSGESNTIHVWEPRTTKLLLSIPLEDPILGLGINDEGSILGAATNRNIRIWDLR